MLLWSLLALFLSFSSWGVTLTITSPANGTSYPSTQTNITLNGTVSPGKGTTGTVVCTGNRTASFPNDTTWMRGYPLANGTNVISCTYSKDGSTDTKTITVYRGNISPVADFSFSPSGGRAPKLVSFDASASTDADGTITSYSWNFGDGTTGTGAQVNHTFQTQGSYNVQLTITDNTSLTSTITKSILILEPNEPPVASFTAPTTGKTGSTITFDGTGSSDSDGTINYYLWTFSDGGSGITAIRTKSFSTAGTYTAELKVTDDKGDFTTLQKSITIVDNIIPVADFSFTPSTGQYPLSASFDGSLSSDSDGSIVSYAWEFGDGATGTGITANHVYTASGTYLIKLSIIDNDGSPRSKTKQITVLTNNKPTAVLSSNIGSGEVPLGVNFDASLSTDSDGGVQEYKMNYGDGSQEEISTLPYFTHTYIASGNYVATLWVKDFAGLWSDPTSVNIVANPANLPPVIGSNQNLSMYEDGSLSFSVSTAVDPESQSVTYHLVSGPSAGTLSGCLNGTSAIQCQFVPPVNFNGNIQIVYKVFDGVKYSTSNGTINITVNAVNDLPVVGADQIFEGPEDTALNFTLFQSTDVDGDPLTYSLDNPLSVGTLVGCLDFGGGLNCTYFPPANFTGEVTFTYKASDQLSSSLNVAVVTLNIQAINDAPQLAVSQSFSGTEDQTLTFTLTSATDPDSSNITYKAVVLPDIEKGIITNCLHGSSDLTCDFIPTKDFNGSVIFEYKANDSEEDSNTSVVTLNISQVNDAPILGFEPNRTTLKNTVLNLQLSPATDIDSSSIEYSLVATPTGGTLSNCLGGTNDLSCTFTPDIDFTGDTTFSFRAYDGQLYSETTTVRILINNPPLADFEYSTPGDAPFTMTLDASSSNDLDGAIINYEWHFSDGAESNGKVINHIFDEAGSYDIELKVYDDLGASTSVTKTVTINEPNELPTAQFTMDINSGPPPLNVSFDASTSTDDGTIVSYEWQFEDNQTGAGQQTTHTFLNLGTYKVTLKVTDNRGGQSISEKFVYVKNTRCNGENGSIHLNGGGFVASTATVEETVYLGEDVEVCDTVLIEGYVSVEGRVKIYDEAHLEDSVKIEGPDSNSSDWLEVYNTAHLLDGAKVSETAKVYGSAKISGSAEISGSATVYENAIITSGLVTDASKVYGRAFIEAVIDQNEVKKNIYGESEVFDDAKVVGLSQVSGNTKVYGSATIQDSKVSDSAEVFGNASISSINNIRSWIYGSAKVDQLAKVYGSFIGDNATVTDFATITYNGSKSSFVFGNAVVKDFATISGSSVFENAKVFSSANIINNSKIYGSAQVGYDVDGLEISFK